jgi:hypothetical protein
LYLSINALTPASIPDLVSIATMLPNLESLFIGMNGFGDVGDPHRALSLVHYFPMLLLPHAATSLCYYFPMLLLVLPHGPTPWSYPMVLLRAGEFSSFWNKPGILGAGYMS